MYIPGQKVTRSYMLAHQPFTYRGEQIIEDVPNYALPSKKNVARLPQPSAQHIFIPLSQMNQVPEALRDRFIDVIMGGPKGTIYKEGAWFLPQELGQQRAPAPQPPAQNQPQAAPNLMDEPNPQGGPAPMPALSARQAAINEIVRNRRRNVRTGEGDQEYAERLRPGITDFFAPFQDTPYGRALRQWGQLPDDQRGPITPEEIAIAERQPDVAQYLVNEHARRMEELQQQQERYQRLQQQRPEEFPANRDPIDRIVDQIIAQNPRQQNESAPNYQNRINQAVRQYREAHPEIPDVSWQQWAQRNRTQQEPVQPAPPVQPQTAPQPNQPQEEDLYPANINPQRPSSGGGGDNNPPIAPGQAVDPRQEFLLDRMTSLMGQIRRTGRRATPTELQQVQGLYQQLSNTPLPAQLQPQLARIERDFNEQAMLLNVPALREIMRPANQAQALGVPTAANGDIDWTPYRTQFPQFFNQGGRLVNEPDAQRQANRLPRADRENFMNLYRKIRADTNAIHYARGDGEWGYDHDFTQNRAADLARHQQQDAQYRASAAYRNTVIPEGPVTRMVQAQIAQANNIPVAQNYEDVPFAAPPVNPQQQVQQQPAAPQQAQTTTGTTYPRLNVAATGNQPPAPAPGNAPALGEQIPAQTVGQRHGRLGQILLGGNAQLLQVPQYTPWQRDIFRELGTMGIESLRQAYQPLFTQERQQNTANRAIESILNRLQNNDPQGAAQELALAGGLGNIQALAQGQGVPIAFNAQGQIQAQPQQLAPNVVNQPGPQGFVLPNMPQQGSGLAGFAQRAAQIGQAYQQAGGGLRGILNAVQQGANIVGQGANIVGQAAQIPANVQNAYQQAGGGILGGIAGLQQGAQDIGNLGQQRQGWEYGPGYGMQYPHPLPFTAANELQRFYGQTVPTLAERFTAAGGGAQRSAAFRGALGSAGQGLGLGLAALGEQQQLANQQQAFNQNLANREFAENQRRYRDQQQQANQLFAFNRGAAMLNTALQPPTTQALLPGGQGILPIALNTAAQTGMAALKAGSMFA